jgi:ABC-type sugar transport system ATPase subunit
MFYVTHDQEEAMALGERVAVLDRGRVQQADRPDALYQRPCNRFVAGFLGWPAMNLLDGKLVWENDRLALVNGTDVFHLGSVRQGEWRSFAGRRVTVGVRPEHVRLARPGDADATLGLEVRLVETLGPDRLLTLRHGDWTVSMRLEKSLTPVEQTTVTATFALARAHLFDHESGAALSHGRPEG